MRQGLNRLAHYLHGLFAGILSLDFIVVSIFLFIQFVAYEFFEETKVKDEMYHELREWSTGYIIGFILAVFLRMIGVRLA